MITALVALLGGVGAAARFVLDGIIRARWTGAFPLATLVINVSGSFVLGFLVGTVPVGGPVPGVVLVLGVGFCGGFTTFSTAMAEAVRLLRAHDVRRAVVYVLGSTVLALGAAAGGVALGRLIG